MLTVSLKDYRITNLQNEYSIMSSILHNTEKHIDILYNHSVLSIYERNQYLKTVNDILRNMNNSYNNYMTYTCDINSESDNFSDILSNIKKIREANFDDINFIVKMAKTLKINEENYHDEPLKEIKKDVIELGNKIGYYRIDEALKLNVSELYDKIYKNHIIKKIGIYNKIFIPTKCTIEEIEQNNDIEWDDLEPITGTQLSTCARLKIKCINSHNLCMHIDGFFQNDSLNIVIKTAQICNNFIFKKKKELENSIDDNLFSSKFKKNYIKNMNLKDILINDIDSFNYKMIKDYKHYKSLIKLTFMNLMKEFVKDTSEISAIYNMYNIIKLLLMGTEDNINIAGLLFGITKDKKLGYETISNILYNNLNYTMQIKLKKTNTSIKAELEKIKSITSDEVDLKKQIALCKNMPNNVRKCALEKLEEMKASNNEYYKQLLYVKTLLNYPWVSNDDDDDYFSEFGNDNKKSKKFLDSIVNKLNEIVYGHNNSKELIKELMGRWLKNPKSAGSSIGLVGPPGVGKTLIAKAIGEALDIPFVQITLGGQNDGEILHGHGYTYSGAQPGMVVKKMVEAGSPRCVMYFDELDKAAKKHDTNEIYNILIHMTDPNMNSEFQDRFFQEINFPLDKVIFIFSYNDSESIDPVLLDRITEIETKAYSTKDKINIAQKFLIKEMADTVSLSSNFAKFNNDDIKYIIEEHTNEAGVRELKRKLEKIFLKMNIDIIYEKEPFNKNKKNIKMNKKYITRYLDKSNRNIKTIHKKDLIGVINGLYATESGSGGITPIQIFNNYTGSDKKFVLKLTGRQGEVMKESVMSGLTTAMHCLKESIRNDFMKNHPYGMHIHTPSGAVPKDGPSAGSAFTTAFISRILGLKIKKDIAMTGEIEPTGKVTKIGGLLYKLNGAKKAGIKLALVPKENKEDLDEIIKNNPELLCNTFKVKTVDHITEIFKETFIGFNSSVLINQ